MPPALQSRAIKAAALIGSGLAAFTRTRRASEATILAFHGLSENEGDPAVLDWSLHLPVVVFHNICALLASDYRVISLADLVEARTNGTSLPSNAVVITFDDGYVSNYKLAYPILRKFDLPATIYVTTGFLDGEDILWFQRVDLALSCTQKQIIDWKINGKKLCLILDTRERRQQSLVRLMPELKELQDTDLLYEVDRLEEALETRTPVNEKLPHLVRPMNWDMVREMSASGYVEIGGHTHTHPILARCDAISMRAEIFTCRARIRDELGKQPAAFAYPNGGADDFNRESMMLVREAGFTSACSSINARVDSHVSLFQLPRYGSPESVWEAEATISGAYETLKKWRQSALKAMSMI